ncbi:CGNR zinc finger domain-containing protein [Nocardiopsis sp. MG754419]|uniref:CGNR zinc finger domain-containing protein n=1 Tax=Nocardiopsis sp. MG754419 TaxID=2259865 RepID=UPI0027DD42C7|nr:CGNR zinc finger domain-containing protein [Nocardiopsis sp. MG754419]
MGSTRALADRTTALLNALAEDTVDAARITSLFTEHGEITPDLTEDDVRALREVAGELRHVLAADSLDEAVTRVNALLAREAHPPRLANHGGTHGWHLHVDCDDEAPWDEWFAASTGLFLARLISERQRRPGGVCAAHGCDRVFVETAHGGVQRYCSRRCATRARVAAHRRTHS